MNTNDISTFYRIETTDNKGPFRNEDQMELSDLICSKLGDSHPVPSRDFAGVNIKFSVFTQYACPDFKTLQHWFFGDDVLEALEDADYMVSEYIIETKYLKLGKSGVQILFDTRHAVLVQRLPISTINSREE